MDDKFWAQDPSILVRSLDIDPISDKPKVAKLNALARLSIVVFIIILVFKRSTRSILLPASVLIGTSYLYFKETPKSREGFKPVADNKKDKKTKKDKKQPKKQEKKQPKKDKKRKNKMTDMPPVEDIPDEPINPSLIGVRKLGDKKNRYGFACQQTDDREPARPCIDGDPFGRVDEGINMSDLLSDLIEKPVPYNYRYNQLSQNSIGSTKRAYDYWRNNMNKTPKSMLETNEDRMEELINNRMRSDNLSYCNNPNFSTQNVYGVQVRGLAGYKTVDDPVDG